MQKMKTIKELRKEKRMTQVELARLLDITRTTLIGYETGRVEPRYTMLMAIASILGVPTVNINLDIYSKKNN